MSERAWDAIALSAMTLLWGILTYVAWVLGPWGLGLFMTLLGTAGLGFDWYLLMWRLPRKKEI